MACQVCYCKYLVAICPSPGPPLPPQEVLVQCGHTPGILQVRWKPPPMTSMGTSNGASVIGYAVCTKGQRVRMSASAFKSGNIYVTEQFLTVWRQKVIKTYFYQKVMLVSLRPYVSHRMKRIKQHWCPPLHGEIFPDCVESY